MNATTDLTKLLVDYVKQLGSPTRSVVGILRYAVYARKAELKQAFQTGAPLAEAVKILLESVINEDQLVRKEANRALRFMIEQGFTESEGFVKSLDSFSKFNLENWFVQPSRALYTLYSLVDTLPKLPSAIAESYLELLPTILEGRSTHEVKAMVAQVIENLFANKHLQGTKTKAVLLQLLSIGSQHIPESSHPIEITSLVQCLTQVYLNYNAGMPTFAKELLPKVLDTLTEILGLTPDEVTQFDHATLRLIKDRVTRNIELALIMSCDEYLFPSDEGLDFIGALTIDESEGSLFADFGKKQSPNMSKHSV